MIPGRQVLRVLDLFSGTQSVSRAFLNSGHEVISLDMDPRGAPTICQNILDWHYKTLPRGHFDVVWASCPCEQYSVARSLDTAGSVKCRYARVAHAGNY